MSKYSQLITSFQRYGAFPLEADYIFETESDLRSFCNEPLNKGILHPGLLKVVLKGTDGHQTLYWVKENEVSRELEFVPFTCAGNGGGGTPPSSDITDLRNKIQEEAQKREEGDKKIIGDVTADPLPPQYDTLALVAKGVKALKDKVDGMPQTTPEVRVVKLATPDAGNVATYQITQGGVAVLEKINIPIQGATPGQTILEWNDV